MTSSGNLFLQVEQFLVKPVIVLVADARLGQHVISVVVPADFFDQLGVAGFGFVERHGNFRLEIK